MSPPNRPGDILLKWAAAVSVCAVVFCWIENVGLGNALGRLNLERAQLIAAIASQKEAARKDAGNEEATETTLSEFDLSAFQPKVPKTVERLEDPRFAHLGARQLDSDYAALFRRLRLPEDKLIALKGLLVERLRVEREAIQLAMAEDLSLDDLPDEKGILAAGTAEIDRAISEDLGAEAGADFAAYQSGMSARKFMIQPFAEHLCFGPDSLSDGQLDALAAAASQAAFGANTIIARPPGPPLPTALDEAAARVLSPAQLDAYQDYKAAWDAGRQKATLDLELFAQKQAAIANASSP
jgi:hypothetical protein